MLFNSVIFLIFFPIVTFLYFVMPHRYRWLLLLLASCYFYMSFVPVYILILFFTIAVDFIAGRYIEKSSGKRRKLFLILSILANVGVLFFFKYFNFFNHNMIRAVGLLGWNYPIKDLTFLLPVGLSFHTFQSISYTIEVFRGNQKSERHFGIFALYVMFYPQLVAGPIERPQNLLHQFYEKHQFDFERVGSGLRRMLWGFFKKIVIADRLSFFVSQVFNNVYDYQGISLVIATVFFAFQIYCDFSGYTDIALGAAEVMGFKLMNNFNRPYISRSISEFWKRWHISLSTWFRDYVYIPLGGNRVIWWRVGINILIVFLLSGLWHGANWTYIFWGGLNGLYLISSSLTVAIRKKITSIIGLDHFPKIQKLWQIGITFSLTCFAWIFFRANTFVDAKYIIKNIFLGWGNFLSNINNLTFLKDNILMGKNLAEFMLAIMGILFLLLAEWWQEKSTIFTQSLKVKSFLRVLAVATIIFAIFFLGEFKNQQFIYFRF